MDRRPCRVPLRALIFNPPLDAMTASEPQEVYHRRAVRVAFFGPVRIRKPVSVMTEGVDLCPGGIGLRSPAELSAGTAVELEVFGGRAIFLGTVRWVQPAGSEFRIGVEFSAEDASLIAEVQAMLARAKEGTGTGR